MSKSYLRCVKDLFILFVDIELKVVIRSMILMLIRGIVIMEIIKFIEGCCFFKVGWFFFGGSFLENRVMLKNKNIILMRGIVKSWKFNII